MTKLKDYTLHIVLCLGVAVPVLCCATIGLTSESFDEPKAVTVTCNDGGNYGAIPLEASEGWQVRLRAL